MSGEVRIVTHGFPEVMAAMEDVKVKVDPVVGKALSGGGRMVGQTAQNLALSNVRNIGSAWSQFRVRRSRTVVYVAEKQHRQPGSSGRPNLSPLLHRKALVPAVQQHRAEIEALVSAQVLELASRIGTV